MKKIGLLIVAVAFVLSSGFLNKNKDGSLSLDKAGLAKEAEKATQKAQTFTADAMEKAKKAAASIDVSKEEIIADLGKSVDQMKQKVSGMDPAKLVAYLNQYRNVLTDTQKEVTEYTTQVKDLKWTEKFGAKGKDLKNKLANYSGQLKGLKEQCGFYISKLESYGVDLSSYGIDLSAYGL